MKRIVLAFALWVSAVPTCAADEIVIDVHKVRLEDLPVSLFGPATCPIRKSVGMDCLPWSYIVWVKRVLVNTNESPYSLRYQGDYKTFWIFKERQVDNTTKLYELADDGTVYEKCTHCNDRRVRD